MRNENEDNSPFYQIQRRHTMLMKGNHLGFFADFNPQEFPPQLPEKKNNPIGLGNNVPNPFVFGYIHNPFSLFNQIPNKNVPKTKEKVNPQEAPHNKEEPNPKEKDEPNPKEKEEPNPKENEEPNPKEKEDKKSSRKKYYCEICGDFFPTVDKHIQRSHPEKLAIEKRIVVFLKDFAEFKRLHENVKKIIQSLTPEQIHGISLTNKAFAEAIEYLNK